MQLGKDTVEQTAEAGRGWILAVILSVLTILALSLVLVWLNVERTDLGYQFKNKQDVLNEVKSTHSKLEIERDHLLTPEALTTKARELGLRDARPGQIRRMDAESGKIVR